MEIISEISENKFKLSLGSTNEDSLDSALETTHEIEEFDIWLEIKSDSELQRVKALFEKLGGNVQKLTWCNWSQHELAASQVAELLGNFKSLKSLKFSSWNKPFTGDAAAVDLPNIESVEISECGNFVIDFLAAALPENTVKRVKVDRSGEVDEKFASFLKKQTSVVSLDLQGDFHTAEPITALKLERLRVILYEKDGETDNQKKFLSTLITSQADLIDLDLLGDSDYGFSFVDDAILADIAALSKLENLAITVDGLTEAGGIKALSNLSALKNLQLKTNRESSLALFKELSESKISSLESLVLKTWTFEIPTETYAAFGANFESLKSLKITLGTRHKISTFAKAFPNLEELNVRFGEANNRVEFGQVFDAGESITQSKLKKLRLQFWGAEVIDTDLFLGFLGVFSNLEKLDIHTKFPFSADFINQLSEKLGTIKSIKLSSFEVRNNETFPAETIDALKALREKVNYASLSLANVQQVDFGHGLRENEDGESRDFTYQPLIDALKGVYETSSSSLSNIRIHNNLVLTAGKEE